MQVFRICLEKWSKNLTASGYPARWNSKGTFVIYTAGSRALACLENVVHRSGEGLNKLFKVMVIEIPDQIDIHQIEMDDLPDDWTELTSYSLTQAIGDKWIQSSKSAVMSVPSSIIAKERNFLLNPNHKDFRLVKLIAIEDFDFDPRIKQQINPQN